MESRLMARIVFDLDGTLIDSAPDIRGIANQILAEEGLAPIGIDDARSFIGQGAAVFVAKMRQARDIPDSAQGRLLAAFVSRYDDAVELTVPYPDVVAVLDRLRAEGHVMGVCTNKPERPARAVLAHLDLLDRFANVLGGDSLPVHKPDPAPLIACFDALGTGQRIYVGDSEIDAETAQRAGVPFLLFSEGYRKSDLSEIPHWAAFDRFDQLPGMIHRALADAA
jgi:phosphoglycolate phosphatase